MPESQETVQVIPGSKLLWRVNTRPPNSAQVCAPSPSQAPSHPVTLGAPCPPSPMTPTLQHSAQASTHTSGPGYTVNPQCLHQLCLTERVSKPVSRENFSDLSILVLKCVLIFVLENCTYNFVTYGKIIILHTVMFI